MIFFLSFFWIWLIYFFFVSLKGLLLILNFGFRRVCACLSWAIILEILLFARRNFHSFSFTHGSYKSFFFSLTHSHKRDIAYFSSILLKTWLEINNANENYWLCTHIQRWAFTMIDENKECLELRKYTSYCSHHEHKEHTCDVRLCVFFSLLFTLTLASLCYFRTKSTITKTSCEWWHCLYKHNTKEIRLKTLNECVQWTNECDSWHIHKITEMDRIFGKLSIFWWFFWIFFYLALSFLINSIIR